MSVPKIDDELIESIIVEAIGPWSCIQEARVKGVYLVPARARAIELAVPLGRKLAQLKFDRMPSKSRVLLEDLEGASAHGVIDGIDRFDPSRGAAVSTLIHRWVNTRMNEEVERTHWTTCNPGKANKRKYFGKGGMTDEERRKYEARFMIGLTSNFDDDDLIEEKLHEGAVKGAYS